MARTYVVADIHGRHDLLCKALDLIEAAAPEGGTFICLGDFIDRGPQSRNVVDLLMAGPRQLGGDKWKWVALQGNHEAMMLETLSILSPEMMHWWVRNGGGQTLASYGYKVGDKMLPLKVPDDHLDWMAGLPTAFEDDHRIYVHAGVPFDTPLGDARRETLQWMRYPGDVEGEAEVHADEAHVSGKHVVHGHHQSETHPLLKPHRTNLDSFAWYSGRLAIGVFDDDKPGGPIKIMDAISWPHRG